MFYLIVTLVLLLKTDVCTVNGANILGLMGMPSPSHHIWNSVLMHRLAEQGHNVTVLSTDIPNPKEKLSPNLHYIHLEEAYSFLNGEEKFDMSKYISVGSFESVPLFYDWVLGACIAGLKSEGVRTLLNYPNDFKFDLVIHDYTGGPHLLGFMHKFNYPPLVGMSAFHNPPNTIDSMSNHYFPAYVPYFSTTFAPEMNFWQRLENTLIFIYDTAYRRLIYLPKADALMRSYFSKDMPYVGDILKRTAISLVNSHPATNYVEPLPPNVIEVGGMQILDPRPLPDDLNEFMNNAKNGVIFVSFGTNMKSEAFTEKQVHVIVSAMAQLPKYKFMWKFDVKYLKEELPANVLVKSFFPQRDILAHPKLKAFVTHCGGLSSHESIWRGVPMIGIPLFADQHRNLRQSMLAGVAEKIDFFTMTTDNLRDTIKKVVEDPEMRARIKAKSAQYRDRPMRPLETAVWWMEYLIRNPDPYHLKSPAQKLNIFSANSLDCLLFICCVLVLLTFLVVTLLSVVWRTLSRSKSTKKATKIKRN